MSTRSAVDTIAGYFYQFDQSIWSLLSLKSNTDSISIECVEDIDIHTATETTAVQCKYYAKSDYNHSVIKPAVIPMLTHFSDVKNGGNSPVRYKLWGHYRSGHEKLPASIDVAFLKTHLLTFKEASVERHHHLELGLSDADLEEFLKLLVIDIRAKSFEDQFAETIGLLQEAFKCTPFAAEYFYYNSALRVIKDLSISADETRRSISKKDFLSRIDTSGILFGEWFVARKGKKLYFAELRKQYFTTLNVSPFERFFMVEIDGSSCIRAELKELIFVLAKKYSRLTSRDPTPFCPYLFVKGITADELVGLKKELVAEGFRIIDGHDFQGADFNPLSIQQTANHGNGIKLKILNSLADLTRTVSGITGKSRCLFQFHLGTPYCGYSDGSVSHLKIQVEHFKDIKEII